MPNPKTIEQDGKLMENHEHDCEPCEGTGSIESGIVCGTTYGQCSDGMCGGCTIDEKCETCDGRGHLTCEQAIEYAEDATWILHKEHGEACARWGNKERTYKDALLSAEMLANAVELGHGREVLLGHCRSFNLLMNKTKKVPS